MANPSKADYEALIIDMRLAKRPELIHYAGAAHRDPTAARMCEEYRKTPNASVRELKARVLGIPENQLV